MNNPSCISSPARPPRASLRAADDRALVARLQQRDATALRQVMDLHAGTVHRVARAIVADPGTVEEIAQDVFLALWNRPERFDAERAALGTYLGGMARNKAIDKLRSHYARERLTDAAGEEARSGSGATTPEHAVDLRASLIPLIESLPPIYRDPIVLAFYGGRTYKQVARELEIPEGTAKTRLRQALRTIRAALQDAEPLLGSA